mgnify:CR=1 FL=1
MELMDELMEEKEKVLLIADNPEMKEVRGLEDRLFGLEQLSVNAKRLVQEQKDYSQVRLLMCFFCCCCLLQCVCCSTVFC